MLFKLIPGLKTLMHYPSSNLSGDLTAGMIVAVLLIPQSMAYAIIAGVPLEMGLYAATFPLIFYALFGKSKYLSVGPVSIVSLIVFTGVSGIAQPNTDQFLELVVVLGLMVGCLHLIMGLLKIGDLFDYISPSVINGFISAAAIIIAVNQIKELMGVTLPAYHNLFQYSMEVIRNLPKTNLYTLAIGFMSIFILAILKKRTTRSPGPLLVVLITTVAVQALDLNKMGVEVVGEIPSGLPELTFQMPSLHSMKLLLPVAVMIAFISFLESFAVVKVFSSKEKDRIHANQELIGLGLANIVSSFVGSIPVAGGLSRTAVNYQAGAKSKLSLLFTALFVLISLLYLTPLFYYLPKSALAAIIIVAVVNLIKIKQLPNLLKKAPYEALIYLATFVTTLMIDIFLGLIIGIILSIIMNQIRKGLYYEVYTSGKK
ncbi:SulP family inorganic anion transporter [Neobacillus kokaensis]|uniref:SLC26A/SulP transporter domain-containing protein n=1 Tax=Neobacillus kokaensis TaxID=2759023 RepID=A0ABQ3N447_9BACI|nr:SulP family inorganic anion transporter [Neobacillus kokaensis]GHH99414.1 hypothetical protein AM1BK_29570 [Neobacillus kokaensis]